MAPSLDNFDAILIELAQIFEKYHIQYALIGGQAVSEQTRPRFTKDLDFLISIPQQVLPRRLEELHARGSGSEAIPLIQEWVQHHMVNFDYQGLRIDWLKPAIPLHQLFLNGPLIGTWMERWSRWLRRRAWSC